MTSSVCQEEYQEKHPTGESGSPYVLLCTNPQVPLLDGNSDQFAETFVFLTSEYSLQIPQELVVKFPMKGEHKIFKLETQLHNAAKKTAKKGPAL